MTLFFVDLHENFPLTHNLSPLIIKYEKTRNMYVVTFYLFFSAVADFFPVSAICPTRCECDIDEYGRKRVQCLNGGVTVPDDLSMLDYDTKVLIVTGFEGSRPNIINLPTRIPNGLPMARSLEEVHLCYSEMETLGDKPFFQMSETLRFLNLSHNALTSISESNFNNLSRVTELYMEYNQLTTMPSITTFRFMLNLKILNLKNNHIDDISHVEIDIRDRRRLRVEIERLDISSNPLGAPAVIDHSPALPDYFFYEFPGLQYLNISNCSLTELPWPDIQKYSPLLVDLDISYNQFTSIEVGQLDVTRLRNISLRGNPIEYIQAGAFSGMYLETLDLSELPPDILTAELFEGVRIERLLLADMGLEVDLMGPLEPLVDDLIGLDVSGNPDLPMKGRMFEFLPYLAEISLARNKLEYIRGNLFRYENEIEVLDLSENRFEGITPAFFQPLIQLAELDLKMNLLQTIPMTIALPELAELDLSENKFQEFLWDTVSALKDSTPNLAALYLNGNPWRCDCGIADLLNWVRTARRRDMTLLDNCTGPMYTESYRQKSDVMDCAACHTPRSMRGSLLQKLPSKMFSSCTLQESTTQYSILYEEEEPFQCYACLDPWYCSDTAYMTVVNCDDTYGRVTSCLKIEDINGIERGCGEPDEEVLEESCEEELGPYSNYTTCTCITTLCNEADPSVVIDWRMTFFPAFFLAFVR